MKRHLANCLLLILPACTDAEILGPADPPSGIAQSARALNSTMDELLALNVGPIAIGHRGYGENLGQNPDKPIENTIRSVKRAFREGVVLVEVDLQITADGQAVVHHDDFLPDMTCINALTRDELEERAEHIPDLRAVLEQAKHANQESGSLTGLVVVELKAPAPMCDPTDATEAVLVAAAVDVIRRAGMAEQVLFSSFSPALLALAAGAAPEIERELDLSLLQLLPPEVVTAYTGLPVTIIDKGLDLGLTWAELGPIYRLPGYASVQQFLMTGFMTGSRQLALELMFLGQAESTQPGSAAALVAMIHSFGLRASAFTVNTAQEWFFAAWLGVDAIYTNDIPMGLAFQPPL